MNTQKLVCILLLGKAGVCTFDLVFSGGSRIPVLTHIALGHRKRTDCIHGTEMEFQDKRSGCKAIIRWRGLPALRLPQDGFG